MYIVKKGIYAQWPVLLLQGNTCILLSQLTKYCFWAKLYALEIYRRDVIAICNFNRVGKIKNEQSHDGRTSILDAIVMLNDVIM